MIPVTTIRVARVRVRVSTACRRGGILTTRISARALAAVAVAAGALAAGCTSGSPAAAPSPSASPADPALVRACADVHAAVGAATGRFSEAMAAAVAAGERGDAAAQRAAMADLREAFAGWSSALRDRAGRAPDPRLATVLTEYAGAVDAAIARVESPADLDLIHTFTETEVDIAASRLAEVCP